MSRALTRDEAIEQVQSGLSFRNANTGVLEALRWAQDQLENGQSLPWFLREEDDDLVGTASVGFIVLPDGFLREDEEADWWVTVGSEGPKIVKKRSWSEVKEHRLNPENGETEEGTPLIYAITNTNIEVSPVPTEAWTLTTTYFKAADDLADEATNVWLENAPDILWGEAGIFLAKKLHDKVAEDFFRGVFTAAEKLLKNEIAAREDSNREYSMGRLI